MIAINGRILENLYTTDAWTTANPVLVARVEGYEVDVDGNPIGMKIGDGVTHWVDLPYWFTDTIPGGQVIIPITTNPFTYASGITSRKPPIEVCLKVGTVLTPYGVASWDSANGNITTDVYNGADTYVLVVG